MSSTITLVPYSDANLIANIQREMLELAKQGSFAIGSTLDGFFDDYQSNAGIDAGLSTNYIYDGTGKKVTPVEATTGNIEYEDVTDVGVSSGTSLIQDIKASITTFTKDASTRGHFNVANAAVTTGCVITFADASTAIIIGKTGDGTGASSIALSVDHATDASLASITGIIYTAPNATLPSADGVAETTFSGTLTTNSTGWTNYSLREVYTASVITTSGTKVRVTFTAPNATFTVAHASIGELVSGCQVVSCNELLFSGGSGFSISSGASITSDWLTFAIDETKGYVVIFDITSDSVRWKATTGVNEYYKAGATYNVTNPSGTTNNSGYNYNVTKIEVLNPAVPTGLFALHTNSIQLNTSGYTAITNVAATQTTPGSSVIYHAACVNKGNAAEKWWVYLSSAWRSIVELVSGTWKYRDAGGTLQAATINSRLGALAQAFGIAQNQLSAAALTAITSGQWATPFVAGTFDVACGLQASGTSIPTLDKWTVTYNLPGQNMSLVSTATPGLLSTPVSAKISLLVKGFDGGDTMKAYFSSATSPSWTELTGLAKIASNISGVTGVDQYVSGQIAVTGSADKSLRTKVEMNCGQNLELHAQVVSYA
jgi:hypothetical protein